MVLAYSSRVSLWKVTRSRDASREASPSFNRPASHSTTFADSAGAGWGSFLGGISPELIRLMISAQCIAETPEKSGDSVSRRNSPFCTFASWQRLQCSAKNGATERAKSPSAGAASDADPDPRAINAKNPPAIEGIVFITEMSRER